MSIDHNGWYNRIFSAAYDPFMSAVEANALRGRRESLLGALAGKIIEIGCGTGANFSYYPAGAEVLALEPSDAMRKQAEEKLSGASIRASIRLEPWLLEDAELARAAPEQSFDAAVCTLVLCTVPDPAATLRKLHALLKPTGKLVVLEHVRAKGGIGQTIQNLMNPLWRHVAEGCQLNRDTHAAIVAAGFKEVTTEEFDYGLPFLSGVYKAA